MRIRVLLVCVLAATLAATCEPDLPVSIPGFADEAPSDEVQIAAVLNDVHLGMESRRLYKVLAHVSTGYRDSEGREYEDIREYLNVVLKNYRTVRITRGRPIITVQGSRAQAVETFGTSAESFASSGLRPVNLNGQVTVHLEKVDNTWKITEWSTLR
jgi:hypothetical protein